MKSLAKNIIAEALLIPMEISKLKETIPCWMSSK